MDNNVLPPPPPPPSFSGPPPSPSVPPPPPPPPPPLAPSSPPEVQSAPSSLEKPRPSRRLFGFIIVGLVLILVVALGFALFSKISPMSKPATLTYWGLWESEEALRPIFSQFEATHPKIKVNYIMQSHQEYRERLQAALSQGRGPDVFRLHNSWIPMLRAHLSSVPPDIYSASEFESTFYPTTRSDLRWNNSYVAIPLEYDGLALFVNDEILAASGQSVPQNWDDLRNAALVMSRCESVEGTCTSGGRVLVSGAALGTTDNVDHWQDIIAVIMLQNNVNLNTPHLPSTKAADDVLEYFSSFNRTYRIWDSTLGSSTSQFAAGKVGFYFGPSWRIIDIKKINPNLKFSVHPLPQLPVDPVRGEVPIAYASYWAEGVNAKSANSKAAWELLKYLSSAEIQTQLFQALVTNDRPIGEPYSRVDLASQLENNPLLSPYLKDAPIAKSWYLTSFTHDGPTGINTRFSDTFAKAVNHQQGTTELARDIGQILSEYGLAASLSPQ